MGGILVTWDDLVAFSTFWAGAETEGDEAFLSMTMRAENAAAACLHCAGL